MRVKGSVLLLVLAFAAGPAVAWSMVSECEDVAFTVGQAWAGSLDTPRERADEESWDELVGLGDDSFELAAFPAFVETVKAPLAERRGGSAAPKERRKAKPAAPQRGVFVDAATVLRLANAGARPQGAPVSAAGKRPAGLRLSRVSALGVGVQDGDVLTEVAGAPATDEGAVVAAVLYARAHRHRTVSGRFWRDGAEWNLVVGMPYPARKGELPSGPRRRARLQ